MSARDLNCPLPHQICNADGTLTALEQTFLRRLWERTGSAPGTDTAWIEVEADMAMLSAAQAQSSASAALRSLLPSKRFWRPSPSGHRIPLFSPLRPDHHVTGHIQTRA